MNNECAAERAGLKIGNTIFLLAGTQELICKGCKMECPYKFKDYRKKDYRDALRSVRSSYRRVK